MSKQVIIDYQQIAVQCNSICDIAEKRLQELDEMIAKIEGGIFLMNFGIMIRTASETAPIINASKLNVWN